MGKGEQEMTDKIINLLKGPPHMTDTTIRDALKFTYKVRHDQPYKPEALRPMNCIICDIEKRGKKMSNEASVSESVKDMMVKHPGNEKAMAETMYMIVSDIWDDHEDIKRILQAGQAVSKEAYHELQHWIDVDSQFT